MKIQHKLDVTSYLAPGLDPKSMSKIFEGLVRQIIESGIEFDAIAFQGFSGCIFGPALCMALGKYPAYVRKGHEEHDARASHAWRDVEGLTGDFRYIIVDDLCATGRTVARIRNQLPQATCAGLFFWNQDLDQSPMPHFPRDIPVYYRRATEWLYTAPQEEKPQPEENPAKYGPPKFPEGMGECLGRVPQIGTIIEGGYKYSQCFVDECIQFDETVYTWKSLPDGSQIGSPRGCGTPAASGKKQLLLAEKSCCASTANPIE